MQCQYNLLYREEEREMIPYCLDQGIAVTTFSPLARGWLTGEATRRSETDAYYRRNYGDALNLKIRERVQAIADRHDTTMAKVAIAWVLSKQAICSPIVSAATLEQLDNNVDALNLALTPTDISSLDEMYRPRGVVNDYVEHLPLRHLGGVRSAARSVGTGNRVSKWKPFLSAIRDSKVSRLCFGTMTIGSSQWKPWVLDEAASRPLLRKCLDLGITFFDTANWYSTGESERIVASTLTSMAPRDTLVLATKAFYAMIDDPQMIAGCRANTCWLRWTRACAA